MKPSPPGCRDLGFLRLRQTGLVLPCPPAPVFESGESEETRVPVWPSPIIIPFEQSPGTAEWTGPERSAVMLQPDLQLFLPSSCLGMLASAGKGRKGYLEGEDWQQRTEGGRGALIGMF